VQVDPIKPMSKAPGTEHLKLKCDGLLSSFAFNFNLRRYTTDTIIEPTPAQKLLSLPTVDPITGLAAGAYTRPLLSST